MKEPLEDVILLLIQNDLNNRYQRPNNQMNADGLIKKTNRYIQRVIDIVRSTNKEKQLPFL